MGQERVFLIQNMFPVAAGYVLSSYIDRNTHKDVTVEPKTEKDIIVNAEAVLKLALLGVPILFADVRRIYDGLLSEIPLEKIQLGSGRQNDLQPAHAEERLKHLESAARFMLTDNSLETFRAVFSDLNDDEVQAAHELAGQMKALQQMESSEQTAGEEQELE